MQTLIASEIASEVLSPTTALKRAGALKPALEDGILMTSEILNVVIDERKSLQGIDTASLMLMGPKVMAGQTANRRVFKDYLLSSEVFYVDSSLN